MSKTSTIKEYVHFPSSDNQDEDELSFTISGGYKRRKKEKIREIPIKRNKIDEFSEIQESKRRRHKLISRNTQNSFFDSEEEDELTETHVSIPEKLSSNKKLDNKKKDPKKLTEISNKYETNYNNEDIVDIVDKDLFKLRKKTKKMKETRSSFQKSNQSENGSIGECIEVRSKNDINQRMDSPCSLQTIIEFSGKEDFLDILSDDPLTSSVNTCTSKIKKRFKKSNKSENNKYFEKDFDEIIEPNSINHKNENNSIVVETILDDSENILKKKTNYIDEENLNIIKNKSFFNVFKNHILEKLTGRKYAPIIGLDSEYTKLRELLYQTIRLGESNTCLIIGPKSSGKSNIVDTAINSLNEFSLYFFVVRLNGIIQTDDRLALKEIARQLNVKMNLDDKENTTSSYSENLFKILTILSHPRELNLVDDNKTSEEFDASYNPLSSNNITFVSIIFILDNFHLFTQHHRQTLLYNLFDISQAKKAPIAVIGLTSSLDSVESLEKRVKSRFSHRIIQIKYPDNLELFIKICRSGLTIDCDASFELPLEEEKKMQFIRSWNGQIDNLFKEGSVIYRLTKRLFMTSKDVRIFYSHCIIPIISLSALSNLEEKLFISENFFSSFNKINLLNGISLLQLSLLVCAARINARDIDTLNFNMVYKEYFELVTKSVSSSTFSVIKNASLRLWERDIVFDAWEKLCNYDFLQPCGNITSSNASSLDRECRIYRLEITLMDLISYMEKVKTIPTILKKWCKDVVS